MTNLITLTIPNDDHIALRAFGKALEEMALAHGAEPVQETLVRQRAGDLEVEYLTRDDVAARLRVATEELQQAAPRMLRELRCEGEELQGKRKEPEVDTTAQQVEALGVSTEVLSALAKLESSNTPQPTQGLIQTEKGQFNLSTGEQVDSTGTPWDERIHSTSKALNADGTWRLRRKPKDMDEAEWAALIESVKGELNGTQLNDSEFVVDPYDTYEEGELPPVAVVEPPSTLLYTSENYVHMYRATDNIYALVKSDAEVAEFEADGYVRHSQEQYDAWEGPNTADEGDDYHTDADVVTEQTVAGIPPLPVPPPVALPGSTGATDLLPPPPVGTVVTQPTWDFPKLMTFLTERHGKIDVATVNTLLAQDGLASLQELNAHPDKIGPFVARVKAHLGE